jgi:hypothetical protein
MAKPTVPQIEEFFRQTSADKIDSTAFQLFLDGLRKVRPLTLEEYQEMCTSLFCRTTNCVGPLELEWYEHEGGWEIEGSSKKQWLYTHCRSCGHQFSLRHYGIPQNLLKKI